MIKENNNNSLLPTYFNPILPRNTKILEVVLDNDLIKINFSKEFNNVTESQYKKMVEAITYTLTDIKGINGVELYVDNKIVKYIPNTTTILPTILTKDIGINKVYEIKDPTNIKKTIIYFLGGNSKNYVPVTKYLNSDKEQIEIIIDNLTSYSLKLVDYEINDDKVILNFNNVTSFSDYLDLITYSVFDNYDVNSVVFLENNEKIIEKFRKDTWSFTKNVI